MDTLNTLIYLLPIVFMIHEFEEMIGVQKWFVRNADWIERKYPQIKKWVRPFESISRPAFAWAVLEEFLIISSATILTLLFQWYYIWIALFTAFAFHIVVHIVQWVVIRRYIPVIATSVLSIPYLIWGMLLIVHFFALENILVCFFAGLSITGANLLFVHKLIAVFDSNKVRR